MKPKSKSSLWAARHSFGGAVCAGAALLISTSAQTQNLFVTQETGPNPKGNLFEYTPGGVQSTFASWPGFSFPTALAFNSAGNLFVADEEGNIYEFTPGGVKSTFASGLAYPVGLAFNSAGNLFAADLELGDIYEYTPGGIQSTFASGLLSPYALAFNSAGNLFVGDAYSGNIYEFTPGGVQSTFASGLSGPVGLAFNSAGNLFVADDFSGNIYEYTPGGVQSTFASGLITGDPYQLAFQGETLPVPEPSALGLLAVGSAAFLIRRRKLVARFSYKVMP